MSRKNTEVQSSYKSGSHLLLNSSNVCNVLVCKAGPLVRAVGLIAFFYNIKRVIMEMGILCITGRQTVVSS